MLYYTQFLLPFFLAVVFCISKVLAYVPQFKGTVSRDSVSAETIDI
jgi:hypothetical protein